MSIRLKFTLLLFAWITLILILGVGMFSIFNMLDKNLSALETAVQKHNLYEQLEFSVVSFFRIPKEWALTGDPLIKSSYQTRATMLLKQFRELKEAAADKGAMDAIGKDLTELISLSKSVVAAESPVGNVLVISSLRKIEQKESELQLKINSLHAKNMQAISDFTSAGAAVKKNIHLYILFLTVFGILASMLLIMLTRKMIGAPFNELIKATERISTGDLNYRINSSRLDEFGIIAGSFDEMVGKLRQSAIKNEELLASTKSQLQQLTVLYELGTSITSVTEIDELLKAVALEFTRLLDAEVCVIRLQEETGLSLKSSYGDTDSLNKINLDAEQGIAAWVASQFLPLRVQDSSQLPSGLDMPLKNSASFLCIPLAVRGKGIGTLGLYGKINTNGGASSFSEQDMNTATTFASISAVAIEKAMNYETERLREKQISEEKKKMDTLFESVQGGIITLGKEYEIQSANRLVENWTDIKAADLIGKNAKDLFHDREGFCPHCAAQITFQTGQINSITQSRHGSHAELTSYPVKDADDNIRGCVVFIQDITDRVLYHEEILSLYKEVASTKDYLESLIENSADAIVTSDMHGIITSWNNGAERIYGYAEIEAVGKYLPFVPEFLAKTEEEYRQKIQHNETIKDIETLRKRKDGSIIEVSLTLSPIKDTSGEIIGISGISRDISERKRVEKELIRRNQELSRLFFISSAMRGTLELTRLLRMILTAVTMSDGLGFNRAILFLVDEGKDIIKGAMGVGPANHEEAWKIWGQLSIEKKTLAEMMQDIESGQPETHSFLDNLSAGIEMPLGEDTILTRTVKNKTSFYVADVKNEPLADVILVQQLGTQAYATVPLISRDKVIGVLWVDNLFTMRPVTEEDMRFLAGFTNHVASAIENARLFDQVSRAEAELENIFRSISDMVFITDNNYTIKNINKAVAEKIGKPVNEIIGRKCYEIFHGTSEPFALCPHHKTVETKKAYIEEVTDSYLGGTFLTSSSPLFDPAGAFLGTVHVVRDISELNLLRERLESAQRMAALGEVAAKVAHEIRNPLVSVGGFARRLEKKLDGNLREYAVIIAKEVARLEDILKDILGFVKEARLAKKKIRINALIEDILSLIQQETRDKGIILEKQLEDTPPVVIDPDRVKEALLNIFNNAIQAMAAHGRLTVSAYTLNNFVVTEISDTGTGIEQKDLPFIFIPFYTTKTSGTGLGLAITNRIIEEHKGKIEVQSETGKGTTFKVFLPLKEDV